MKIQELKQYRNLCDLYGWTPSLKGFMSFHALLKLRSIWNSMGKDEIL